MTPLRPGSVFAKAYEIVRPISAGGMGIVYEVIHLGTRRRRALKIMLAHIVSDPKMRERFTLEAVVTADIESEHLTEVFDAGIDSETDCPYLVMELLRGEDLGARLKRGERTSGEATLVLMDQVAHALDRTHARGVVHRDLKPDNLFVALRDDGSPRIKILDFGIAKLVRTDVSGAQATTKTFGTPYYMAREQITGESALIGPASDLYAVAHIVFALLTGRPYFEDEARKSDGNVLALLMAVGQGAPEKAVPRALRRGVELPSAFDAWFDRASALAPSDRFQSARSMVDALREVLREPVRIIGPDVAVSSERSPDGVAATSSRLERSLGSSGSASSSQDTPSAQDLLHQTGAPQSITAQQPTVQRKRGSRGALVAAGIALVAAGVGVAGWRLSQREPGSGQAGSGDAPATTASATPPRPAELGAAPEGPSVAPTLAVSAVASAQPAATEVALAASASASASTTPVERRPGGPRPPRTAGAPAPELWETR